MIESINEIYCEIAVSFGLFVPDARNTVAYKAYNQKFIIASLVCPL